LIEEYGGDVELGNVGEVVKTEENLKDGYLL